ncbi:hypothetical protein [Pseudomonas sp. EpS/L25]|uniref:hypothetical protein n=1 Tax=Pseudomonas sp. EpS/L25 TaxID=1749078 RepID=UPI0007442EDC|nr:hypothetical protein [Pseudomonas sp. EpS/L25]KUM43919.1 hypothetical protein AR540_19300 [Pseudomonas sp. EpS/L25]
MKQLLPLDRVSKATGLKLDQQTIVLTFSLQTPEQTDQYIDALNVVTVLYEDALLHGGAMTEAGHAEWQRLNKQIAFWAHMTDLAMPQRRGWFRRKTIHPIAWTTLLRTLSPDAPIIKARATGLGR